MAPTIDPRIQQHAYISRNQRTLWQVLGPERDQTDCITGLYELENASGTWSSYGNGKGVWIHQRIAVTATQIANEFELVKHAPIIDHLAREFDAHCRKQGLSLDGQKTNLGGWQSNAGLKGGRLAPKGNATEGQA